MSVEVKEQVRLSLGKCVELVLSGIKYRLFRAAITVVIISLAVAFLMNMLSETLVARKVSGTIRSQTADRDTLLYWVKRISKPFTPLELSRELAAASASSPHWQEFAAWGNLNDEMLSRLSDIARRQQMYLAYFEGLPEGARRRLVGPAKGHDILDRLSKPQMYELFAREYQSIERKLPAPLEQMEAFLADWQQTRPWREQILQGHLAARESLDLGPNVTEALAEADEKLLGRLSAAGFRFDRAELDTVRRQARLTADASWLASLLKLKMVKSQLGDRRFVEKTQDVDVKMLYKEVGTSDGSQWLARLVGTSEFQKIAASQAIADRGISAEQMRQAAEDWLRKQRLADVEEKLVGMSVGEGFWGLSGRAAWLLVVSFMVCVVGIANAMLMSVTERFREIATMKCLGATDGFIMINFILESVMQGVAGGLIGAVLGLVLGTLRSWASYGWIAVSHFPLLEVASAGVVSILVGVVISALAAVYPAGVAARLAPMEAMRIE